MDVTQPNQSDTDQIARFLGQIGLPVRFETIDEPTVLPGITIDHGILVVDEARLQNPGDLLHEAGHLAVTPSAARSEVIGSTGSSGGYEMAAIAWSYAALRDLDMDPSVVFHDNGYRGGSENLIENFEAGRYLGVPMLQWLGLSAEPAKATELGIQPYPHMIHWVVD